MLRFFKKKYLDYKRKNRSYKKRLLEIQDEMLKAKGLVDLPVIHHFGHNCYARELFIPEGMLVMGKTHKTNTINILVQGEISIWDGVSALKKVKAPFIYTAKKGEKKMGYTHTDTIWVNVLGTSLKDHKKIEKKYTLDVKQEKEELKFKEALKCLLQ